jgi:excisionase family DNA binding protein
VKRSSSAPDLGPHLTITELSDRLQVPVETIYVWNHTGKGPTYMKVGRHVRYALADVIEWERSRKINRADRWR